MKHNCLFTVICLVVLSIPWVTADAQEKVVITHSSESISITPLIYGIERSFYRKEGIDLQFRVLRGELAVSSIVSGKDVDYMYGAGTAFFAAVRGLPMKVNTTMLVTTTRNRNDVPQRGWKRENVCTLSGVSGAPASSAWIALCSAP